MDERGGRLAVLPNAILHHILHLSIGKNAFIRRDSFAFFLILILEPTVAVLHLVFLLHIDELRSPLSPGVAAP